MEDIFSRVTAIILGCVLMFFAPVRIMSERQKNMNQTYIFTETINIVDSVCNKGILYKEVYEQYIHSLGITGGLYNIYVEHYSGENGNYTGQILRELDTYGYYKMNKGDIFKIKVSDISGDVLVFYGGCIKDEDY